MGAVFFLIFMFNICMVTAIFTLICFVLGLVGDYTGNHKRMNEFVDKYPQGIIIGVIFAALLLSIWVRQFFFIFHALIITALIMYIVYIIMYIIYKRNHKDNNQNYDSGNVVHTEEDVTDYSDRIID